MPKQVRPPGMVDVAKLAGVSHQTVSRVLNAPNMVRASTREKVEQAIAELGYQRNLAARTLATHRSRLIGVIVANSDFHGPAETALSVQSAAHESGYAAIQAAVRSADPKELGSVVSMLLNHSVEGIVVIAPQEQLVRELQRTAARVPMVVVADSPRPLDGMHEVCVDQRDGARKAVEHLIATGHRTIAHIAGPPTWLDATQRRRSWLETLAKHGLPPATEHTGDWSAQAGYEAAALLITEGALPEAVFCANDLIAIGVAAGLKDAGISIPEDISIVGFDDIPSAPYQRPALTTVRQPFKELGRACMEVLSAGIEGVEPGPRRTISATLVQRSSVQVHRNKTSS
ncbi:LacI family DNA-binding transcriptional regulator [Helcobacillus massiliensis]